MKITAIIPNLNNFEMLDQAIEYLLAAGDEDVDVLVLDNGSTEHYVPKSPRVSVIRSEKLLGTYGGFKVGFENCQSDILAFFHSDVFVYDPLWHKKVIAEFERDPQLGLLGFFGSNEIDFGGGRGLGTVCNFQGRTTKKKEEWTGSPAEHHGRRIGPNDLVRAAVLDGLSMIFRREAMAKIKFKEEFPLHHFYDRLFSVQIIEAGYKVAVLGIEHDHLSGRTVNSDQTYKNAAKEWCLEHLGITRAEDYPSKIPEWFNSQLNPNKGKVPESEQWDMVIYLEAERQFLTEYRDQKRLIPIRYA